MKRFMLTAAAALVCGWVTPSLQAQQSDEAAIAAGVLGVIGAAINAGAENSPPVGSAPARDDSGFSNFNSNLSNNPYNRPQNYPRPPYNSPQPRYVQPQPRYVQPQPVYVQPQPRYITPSSPSYSSYSSPSVTLPKNHVPSAVFSGDPIKIRLPSKYAGKVSYLLGTYTYTIESGESQTIAYDRDWKIQFEDGSGKNLTYALSGGTYEFRAQDGAWNLVRTSPNVH